jgi:Flp pilus assembly pilin Flp
VRQLIRRLCACDSGAGTVEYALLIAVLALGLIGVLSLFRNTIGSAVDRTAVTVSTQTAGGYGVKGTIGGGHGGGAIAHEPTTGAPDSPSPDPDSLAASGGTAVASSRPVKP